MAHVTSFGTQARLRESAAEKVTRATNVQSPIRHESIRDARSGDARNVNRPTR
jgi:hypothetical protein